MENDGQSFSALLPCFGFGAWIAHSFHTFRLAAPVRGWRPSGLLRAQGIRGIGGARAIELVREGVEEAVRLGQVAVDKKSNEIRALPVLLEMLDIKGAVVTADAMHTRS